MEPTKKQAVLDKLKECLAILECDAGIFVFSKEGKDFEIGAFSIDTNPLQLFGYARYIEGLANQEMNRQNLEAKVQEAVAMLQKQVENSVAPKDSDGKEIVH